MYYIVYGFLYLISLLPMRLLYVLADGLYILIYHVFGYRKKVVMGNLFIAFPEKTEADRIKIAKQFYLNFSDYLIEFIKQLSASEAFLKKRFTISTDGLHELNELYKTGRPCQIHLGHTFNWEWGQLILKNSTPYKLMVVYMPISNKIFEKIFYDSRTRSGSIFLPATSMRAAMAVHHDTQYLLGLVADQNPGALSSAYWVNFFGKPTAFVSGPEKAARLRNIPVFFAHIEKPKRGYYHTILKMGELNPSQLKEGELTLRYVKYLQEVIQQNPDMWLWSHRRWKNAWKEEFRGNWVDESEPMP